MIFARPLAVSLGLATGLVGGVAAYSAAAQVSPRTVPAPVLDTAVPRPTVYAPCTAPAKLEHGVCVTHRVVTTVLPAAEQEHRESPAARPAPAAPRTSTRTSAPSGTAERGEDGEHEEHEGDHEDHGGEHGDD